MSTPQASYEQKLGQLTEKVAEIERRSAALRELIKPGFDASAFHTFYDPLMEAAREAHDVYHELLHAPENGN